MRLGQPCTSQFPEFTLASSESSLRSHNCLASWKQVSTKRCRGNRKKPDQSRVRAPESDCAGYETRGEVEAQDCSGLAGVPGPLDSDLVTATLPGWAPNSTIIDLGKPRNRCGVVLTVIVMMPDKNSQFPRLTCLTRWNTSETRCTATHTTSRCNFVQLDVRARRFIQYSPGGDVLRMSLR